MCYGWERERVCHFFLSLFKEGNNPNHSRSGARSGPLFFKIKIPTCLFYTFYFLKDKNINNLVTFISLFLAPLTLKLHNFLFYLAKYICFLCRVFDIIKNSQRWKLVVFPKVLSQILLLIWIGILHFNLLFYLPQCFSDLFVIFSNSRASFWLPLRNTILSCDMQTVYLLSFGLSIFVRCHKRLWRLRRNYREDGVEKMLIMWVVIAICYLMVIEIFQGLLHQPKSQLWARFECKLLSIFLVRHLQINV